MTYCLTWRSSLEGMLVAVGLLAAAAGCSGPGGAPPPAEDASTAAAEAAVADPLPSWNEGAAKQAILDFVERVTDPSSPELGPEPERIATFDNDGWVVIDMAADWRTVHPDADAD